MTSIGSALVSRGTRSSLSSRASPLMASSSFRSLDLKSASVRPRLSHQKAHAPPPDKRREISPELVRSKLPENVASQLQAFPSLLQMDVRWGDMDSYKHVNNVLYARYMEHSRSGSNLDFLNEESGRLT